MNFKKHKSLPHPRKDGKDANTRDAKDTSYGSLRNSRARAAAKNQRLPPSTAAPSSLSGTSTDETVATNSQSSSPRSSKSRSKSTGNGPDLPPTPPAHSRNSSSTYSALPSTATYVQSPERSAEDVHSHVQLKAAALPTTPTKQMSPPTPDVTPPQVLQPEIRPKGPPHRPSLRDRNFSKGTTDSRAESFRTAQEHLSSSSSDDEAALGKLRPALVSTRTSESTSTVRQLTNGDAQPATKKRQPKVVGLGLGLESSPESSLTPQSKRDFVSFDGEWGTGSEELKERGGNLVKNAAPPTHRVPHRNAANPDRVVEDAIIAPTNATKAVRSMSLPQRILTFPAPNESANRSVSQTQTQSQQSARQQSRPKQATQPAQATQNTHRRKGSDQLGMAAPIVANMGISADPLASDRVKRSSTASTRSTVSTVVEAYLMSTPPQRQRTLRHVRKQVGLRDSGLDLSPTSSGTTSLADETARQRRPPAPGRFNNSAAHDSVLSTSTFNSISSRSARREIWKSGGIPVVVVPARMSSVKSTSREPSLRSTSSRRSKRSQSLHSVPLSQVPKSRDISPAVDQRSNRGRTMSESGGSARDGSARGDQRTMDYPPIVPRRTSSLSAPTSRNVSRAGSQAGSRTGSRTGSFTAESAQAQAAIADFRGREQQKTPSTTDVLDQVLAKLQAPSKARGKASSSAPSKLHDRKFSEPTSQVSSQVIKPREAKPVPRVSETRVEKPVKAIPNQQDLQQAAPTLELFPEIKPVESSTAEATTSPKLREFDDHGDDANFENRNLLDPRSSISRHGDRNPSKHLSPNTPFSIVSVETTTSHHSQAEVSEALAVNIYSHQNTSVLVVNHSNRPSEHSDDSQQDHFTDCTETISPEEEKQAISPVKESGPVIVLSPFVTEARPKPKPKPTATATRPKITIPGRGSIDKGDVPATPSQQLFSLDDVDSPLRNPRAPPQPPAINFIPATPSGLTPLDEKGQDGDAYFSESDAGRPRRRDSVSSVLRRALSRGRSATTEYGPSASRSVKTEYGPSASRSGGILSRTLSLTRDVQKRARSKRRSDSVDKGKGALFDDEPVEEDKLHPFWQPASHWNQTDDDEDGGETYRYPPIDNRPHPPRRSQSLGSRMKRTFAILPLDHDDSYPATDDGTDRRTVKRTPSGNLRVVKHLSSSESFKERSTPVDEDGRPYTAPDGQGGKPRVWRSFSLGTRSMSGRGGVEKRAKMLPNISGKIGEYSPHTISRRFSERRREKRSNELRQMISGPREVRDGVGEVIRRTNYRDAFTQAKA